MDCRHFREQHLAYLDDTLPGDAMAEAQRHLLTCDACAAHDTRVRRSLVLVRNHLPEIEPSADFRHRLNARLATCRSEPVDDLDVLPVAPAGRRWPGRQAWLAMAAGLGVVTTAALQLRGRAPSEPQLPPALAVAPAVHIVPLRPVRVQPIAREQAGTSVAWPGLRLVGADRAGTGLPLPAPLPLRAASSEFTLITYTR